jgi:hypothetical protein
MGRCIKLRIHVGGKCFVHNNSTSAIRFALIVDKMINLRTIPKVLHFLNKLMMEIQRMGNAALGRPGLASMGEPTGNVCLRK